MISFINFFFLITLEAKLEFMDFVELEVWL